MVIVRGYAVGLAVTLCMIEEREGENVEGVEGHRVVIQNICEERLNNEVNRATLRSNRWSKSKE